MENTGNGIYKAMASIIKEIGHISKEKSTTGFASYNYRGIDDVYNAINPLMGKFGVFVLPVAQERISEERKTKNNGIANYVILRMKYYFCHEDGSYVECSTIGEAMDSGDKGTNKAMSIAMKYALFQVFCIPTEEMDDPDAVSETFIADNKDNDKTKAKAEKEKIQEVRQQARANNPNPPTEAQKNMFFGIMTRRHHGDRDSILAELSTFFGRHIASSNELTREEVSRILDALNETEAA